jgi:hypothetical protein
MSIAAALYGKTPLSERGVLTSDVFTAFRYLPAHTGIAGFLRTVPGQSRRRRIRGWRMGQSDDTLWSRRVPGQRCVPAPMRGKGHLSTSVRYSHDHGATCASYTGPRDFSVELLQVLWTEAMMGGTIA